MANGIDKDIQVTFEVPSDFEDKKLPFLDTKIWLDFSDKNCPQGKLMSKFYSKPMTAKVGIQVE